MSLDLKHLTYKLSTSSLLALCLLAHSSSVYSLVNKRAEVVISAEVSAQQSSSLFSSLADYFSKNTPQKIRAIRVNLNNKLLDVEAGNSSLTSGLLQTQKTSCKMVGMMVRENSNTILAVLASSGIIYLVDLTCNDGKLMNALRDYASSAKDYLKYYTIKFKDGVSHQLSSLQNGLLSLLGASHDNPVVLDSTSLRDATVDTVSVDQVAIEPAVEDSALDPLSIQQAPVDQAPPLIIITSEAPIIVHLDSNAIASYLDENKSRRVDEDPIVPSPEQLAPPVEEVASEEAPAPVLDEEAAAPDTTAAPSDADLAPVADASDTPAVAPATDEVTVSDAPAIEETPSAATTVESEAAPVDQPSTDAPAVDASAEVAQDQPVSDTATNDDVTIHITISPADAIVVADSTTPDTVTVDASIPTADTTTDTAAPSDQPAPSDSTVAPADADQVAKTTTHHVRRRAKKH